MNRTRTPKDDLMVALMNLDDILLNLEDESLTEQVDMSEAQEDAIMNLTRAYDRQPVIDAMRAFHFID